MSRFLNLAAVFLIAVLNLDARGRQWIGVVAPELRESVEPLANQRRAEGWKVTVFEATHDRVGLLENIARMAQDDDQCCLLLVGDVSDTTTGMTVASGKGTHARMNGKLSDQSWSTAGGKLAKPLPTGRLPARSPEEAEVMVRKILVWPERSRTIGPFPRARFIVGSHGLPPPMGGFADGLINRLALDLARQLPAAWQFDAMVHINGSPWQISSADISAAAGDVMKSASTVMVYMGHSHRRGADSATKALITVDEWRSLPATLPGVGLFFSCGCHTCDFDPQEEAFGVASMRAAGGPSAVIGSQGETYAAMGYLALSGMLAGANADPSGKTLGDIWVDVQQGLREGKINEADFKMMDMADGSGGKVSLEVQRSEHLQSWMLLGDPAMPLLADSLPIQLNANFSASGKEAEVSGKLPPPVANARLRLTLERHPGNVRTDLPEVPSSGEARREATRKRRALSNDPVLASIEVTAEGSSFRTTLTLPPSLPPGFLVLRATTLDQPVSAAVAVQVDEKGGETREMKVQPTGDKNRRSD